MGVPLPASAAPPPTKEPISPVRWAWLPTPFFILLIAGLWAGGWHRDASFESTSLFLALTLVFGLLTSAIMAVLLGRSFLIHRAPELLLIALGAVFWGTAGFAGAVAGSLVEGPRYANTVATVYNVAAWLSALCHLVGATLPNRWRIPLVHPRGWLAATYGFALIAMVGLVLATLDGRLPVFFLAGQGGTLTREMVLSSAIAMLVVTGLLFVREPPRRGNAFKFLYGHALILLAVGILALLTGGPGTLLSWAGRCAHAAGSILMLIGAFQAGRLERSHGLLADRPADEGRLGDAVAVAVVVAAAAVRELFFPAMGDRFLFTIFYPSLVFAAFYGGIRAGVLATVLSALIAAYFWIEPLGDFGMEHPGDWVGMAVFMVTGGLISWMADRMRVAEARVRRANEALLHSNGELQRFAHAMAHDLQTPLRSIAGFTQLLQEEVRGQGNVQVEEWAGSVVDNTRRLQDLIRELLSYTRLEADGAPFEAFDARTLRAEAMAGLDTLVSSTGARVAWSGLPATIRGDRSQLAQVLQNLVENGIKYNESHPPRVSVAWERQDDEWVFSVADNGMGIDPRHHERIFEIFRRLHPYHRVPGTGIGLALCRRIVERHGGRIWVESRPGEGSTFYFSLPI